MKKINRWLKKISRKESRRARLDDALITEMGWKYAGYRLKYLGLRIILRAALHLAEMTLFARVFSMDFLASIIIVRSLTMLGVSIWWGSLEQFRQSVRDSAQEKKPAKTSQIVETWVSLSILASSLTVILGSLWILTHTHETMGFSIYNAYAIACLIRFGLDIIARTYHSGVFAIRRVFRPLWTLLLGDILDVLLVLILWPFLGVWSFSIVFASVGLLRFVLLVRFAKRAYRDTIIPPLRTFALPLAFVRIRWIDVKGIVIHGLANGAAQVDNFFIAMLASSARNGDGAMVSLAVLIYIIRPFLSAGYGWSRLFYFDFKLLSVRYGEFFRQRFDSFTKRIALWFSIGTGLVSALWAWIFLTESMFLASVLLIPIIVLRSFLGLNHVAAFSYGQYWYLGKISAISFASIGALVLLVETSLQMLVGVTTLLLVLVMLFPRPSTIPSKQDQTQGALSLPFWLHKLKQHGGAIAFGLAVVDSKVAFTARVVKQLALVHPHLNISRIGKNTVVWFSDHIVSHQEVIKSCSGALSRLDIRHELTAVDDVLAIIWNMLDSKDKQLDSSSLQTACSNAQELKDRFVKIFPTGQVIGVDRRGSIKKAEGINQQHVRSVLRVVSRLEQSNANKKFDLGSLKEMTVFCPKGEPVQLFIVDKSENSVARQQWASLVYNSSLKASLT